MLEQGVELGAERRALLRGEAVRIALAGVAPQVEPFGLAVFRPDDLAPLGVDEHAAGLRRLVDLQQLLQLAERRARRRWVREPRAPARLHERAQRVALERGRRRDAGKVEDGRGHVDELDDLVAHDGRHTAGRDDDERYAHLGFVERLAVADHAVLVEALAVVGGDDDERIVEEPARGELVEEPGDLGVHRHDGRVVEVDDRLHEVRRRLEQVTDDPHAVDVVRGRRLAVAAQRAQVLRGRIVRRVRLHVLDVEEERRALRLLVDELQRLGVDRLRAGREPQIVRPLVLPDRERLVAVVALRDAEVARDEAVGRQPERPVAGAFQDLGEGRLVVCELLVEARDAVLHHVARRHERRDGAGGPRRLRVRVPKARAARRQLLEERRDGPRRAARGHPVGAHRVDDDENDVRRSRRAAGRRQQRERGDERGERTRAAASGRDGPHGA
jgi:hypothetical protein